MRDEQGLVYAEDDDLVVITPESLRTRLLNERDRHRVEQVSRDVAEPGA